MFGTEKGQLTRRANSRRDDEGHSARLARKPLLEACMSLGPFLLWSAVSISHMSVHREKGQVKNPSRDMPLGIGASLAICTILYMLVSAVIVGLVPYYALDPDTPVSSAFASYGMNWAVYIITTGAVTALCASLIGAIIPQPRILMAMGRDGLLPSFFSDISKHTQVPVKGTLATGIFIATLAFFMDVSQLAGMVSVGTLLAFTTVAISVLVVRYIPPYEFSFPSLLQPSMIPASFAQHSKALQIGGGNTKSISMPYSNSEHLHPVVESPLLPKETTQDTCNELRRRKIAAWAITLVCVGILLLVSAASAESLSSIPRFLICGVGGAIVLCCSTVLACVDQADLRRRFKKSGGVGATIGAGVYILVGTVAREHTGPSLALSFFIGGIAAALSAFCYAELACRCPSAGSAYHFSYVCIGEGVAWLIGWAMILEYTLGGAAAARGISPNLAMYFGGEDKLPAILGRPTILGILVDPGAAILVLIITGLLCTGIKESSLAQTIITTINIFALIFIVIAGAYLGFKTGWVGYELPSGYFPFGINGLLAGSATVFFSYIGFDIVASTSEEVLLSS
nr:cationic amino acid transporter 4, vacuolar-like [Ipomoea batatas]